MDSNLHQNSVESPARAAFEALSEFPTLTFEVVRLVVAMLKEPGQPITALP